MDKFEEELKEILDQSKHKSLGAENFVRASLAENKYPKDFLIYFINSECFGDYESEIPAYETWNYQQAKVEELQTQLSLQRQRVKAFEEELTSSRNYGDELQKRVEAAYDALMELKEKSEALHHRWNILSDSVALAEAEMIDMCVKEIEQALKGEV